MVVLSFEHERIPQYRPWEFPDEHTQPLKRTYLDALDHLVDLHDVLSGFLGHIEEAKRVNKFSHAGKVTLMTIHQAKGLVRQQGMESRYVL